MLYFNLFIQLYDICKWQCNLSSFAQTTHLFDSSVTKELSISCKPAATHLTCGLRIPGAPAPSSLAWAIVAVVGGRRSAEALVLPLLPEGLAPRLDAVLCAPVFTAVATLPSAAIATVPCIGGAVVTLVGAQFTAVNGSTPAAVAVEFSGGTGPAPECRSVRWESAHELHCELRRLWRCLNRPVLFHFAVIT